MKIIGVELRKPTFTELTMSAIMAAGLWIAYMGIAKTIGSAPDAVNAGGVLLVIFWGCVCTRFGIRVDRGVRHIVLNVMFGGVLLLAYQAAIAAVN
ncbi:hypothetical protein BH09PSE5_BH09PSE5_24660 [soil metagenome]